ncbi:histidine kinase [Spirosoma sp. BT702]|uniref:Histidine kinase n=1 Tax=Spirosoma profusum TaxID=2771354 RepID=A0A927ASQ7_9BACT|nr:sensor histidine kinase [Spirosoma profusum]MBD2704248.1 histidine kinase [Spirosoma profusum]
MKLPVYSRYDHLLQLIVLPLYIAVLNWLLIREAYWESWTTFGIATGITLIDAFFNWYINNGIALKVNQMHPDPRQYVVRAFRRFAATGISSSLHVIVLFFIYWFIHLSGFEPSLSRLGLAVLFTIVIVAVVVVTYESIDSFGYWQKSQREVDTLTKAQMQAELNALRQQVNPHFLFNSLNSLITLIGENPKLAETFAEELSSVYRYLLRSNDSPLTPLANELEFLQSYYHLLKTRHGEALSLVTTIYPGSETKQLPPLTLQLLIENAVKHNIILPDQPLTIKLSATENQLIVSNNLQRKASRTLSTGVGLSNILSKYQMMGQSVPVIEDDGREFRVTLPLV